MSEYRIGFLDENKSDRHTFGDFVDDYFPEYEYVELIPDQKMESMTEHIWNQDLDCLVIDYKLDTTFTGSEVYDAVVSSRRDFPTIILTSHEDDAVEHSHEPRHVYAKSVIFSEPQNGISRELLAKKLKLTTEKYRKKINNYETEHRELSQKGELSEQEHAKLMKLDNYLDANYGHGDKPQIPEAYTAKTHTKELRELIEKTDQLINKYDGK